MIDLAKQLSDFIGTAREEPMIWGESDCTTWVAAWIELVHARAVRRPKWHSRDEAMALIARAGSLLSLWGTVLSDFGLSPRFDAPEPGDVGIIETHHFPQVGGIFLHHGLFAWRAEPTGTRLLLPRARHIVKVWAIQ